MMPSIRPAVSLYGESASRGTRLEGTNDSQPAPPGGMAYEGRGPKCMGNNDTCNANKAKGTDWCVGHLKALDKEAKTRDEG